MNTTKAIRTGHQERHHPGANQISTPHQTSQNVMPVQNGMGVMSTLPGPMPKISGPTE
jgi:hypothetical protein